MGVVGICFADNNRPAMKIFSHFTVESAVDIDAPTERVWDFFYRIGDNYTAWHRGAHHDWRWKKGAPLAPGSVADAEETVGGHRSRIRVRVIESLKEQKVALKPAWPVSFMCPRIEWHLEPNGSGTRFVARTHFRFGWLFLRFKRPTVDRILYHTRQHMLEEGQNLKKLLE